MWTRGEGVQNPENFADVMYGCPLSRISIMLQYEKGSRKEEGNAIFSSYCIIHSPLSEIEIVLPTDRVLLHEYYACLPPAIHPPRPPSYWLDYARLVYITADMCLITHPDEICDREGGCCVWARARTSNLKRSLFQPPGR